MQRGVLLLQIFQVDPGSEHLGDQVCARVAPHRAGAVFESVDIALGEVLGLGFNRLQRVLLGAQTLFERTFPTGVGLATQLLQLGALGDDAAAVAARQ